MVHEGEQQLVLLLPAGAAIGAHPCIVYGTWCTVRCRYMLREVLVHMLYIFIMPLVLFVYKIIRPALPLRLS